MLDKKNIPKHVAVIMDGNRRWAKEKNLSLLKGHEAGAETFKKIAQKCLDLGVKHLTVYAFSTENWNRSKEEVSYLMSLLESWLKKQKKFVNDNRIRFNSIGQIEKLPENLRKTVREIMDNTKNNAKGVLNLALSYGGRQEILEAVKKIVAAKISPEKINEEVFDSHLYTAGQPDPDLLIRTSGEQRLSGFLPWQSVYSELYFSQKYWPDFSEADLEEAIEEYQRRKRRFGK